MIPQYICIYVFSNKIFFNLQEIISNQFEYAVHNKRNRLRDFVTSSKVYCKKTTKNIATII